MGIENMSEEELNAALLAEINPEDNTAEFDSTINEEEVSYDEEETEENSAEEEDIIEEVVEPVKDKPKNKNNVAKILSEKNKLAQRVKELESMVWTDRDTDLEYINATATKVALDIIEERDFFKENPEAIEVKDILKWEDYAWLGLDRAWKLYQVENNPESFQIKQNKANAKKYDTSGYSSPKLKTSKPTSELSLDDLRNRLTQEWKAGKVTI